MDDLIDLRRGGAPELKGRALARMLEERISQGYTGGTRTDWEFLEAQIWLAFAVILVLRQLPFFVVRSAEDKVTDRMLSAAARFAIPSEGQLAQEIVRPERFMCISTNPCPSWQIA
ncbi:hypothetical protein HC749_08700 [Arthrobacter sp. S13_S34]|nr:hypothetical protein [Arthrobacter sp. S13_S34]